MSNDFSGYRVIAFNLDFSDDELIAALSELFGIDRDQIMIDRNDVWWMQEQTTIAIVCSMSLIGGEFPTSIEFVSFLPQKPFLFPDLEGIGRLCELLKAYALVSDITTYNPYAWILVRNSKDSRHVYIDAKRADNEDIFVIEEILDSKDTNEGS